EGRKLTAGSALLGPGGQVLATARAVWLTVPRPVPALAGAGDTARLPTGQVAIGGLPPPPGPAPGPAARQPGQGAGLLGLRERLGARYPIRQAVQRAGGRDRSHDRTPLLGRRVDAGRCADPVEVGDHAFQVGAVVPAAGLPAVERLDIEPPPVAARVRD